MNKNDLIKRADEWLADFDKGVASVSDESVIIRDLRNALSQTPVEGWLIPFRCMNQLQKDSFEKMVKILSHGGIIDVVARIDGKDYRWQCDALSHAEFPQPQPDYKAMAEKLAEEKKELAKQLDDIKANQMLAAFEPFKRLITQSKAALKVLDDEYEEHEMPWGYPNPDSLSIAINDTEKALAEHQSKPTPNPQELVERIKKVVERYLFKNTGSGAYGLTGITSEVEICSRVSEVAQEILDEIAAMQEGK